MNRKRAALNTKAPKARFTLEDTNRCIRLVQDRGGVQVDDEWYAKCIVNSAWIQGYRFQYSKISIVPAVQRSLLSHSLRGRKRQAIAFLVQDTEHHHAHTMIRNPP